MSSCRINLCCYSVILSLSYSSGKMSPMNTREETYHMTDKEMAGLQPNYLFFHSWEALLITFGRLSKKFNLNFPIPALMVTITVGQVIIVL